MKVATLSRGPELDTDKIVSNIGNRYDMVIIASARARELRRNNRNSDQRSFQFSEITALLEIQEGKIGKDYFDVKAAEFRAHKQSKK